jgi:hypothetical protein
MMTEEGQQLLVDWDLSESLVNEREVPSPPEHVRYESVMATTSPSHRMALTFFIAILYVQGIYS